MKLSKTEKAAIVKMVRFCQINNKTGVVTSKTEFKARFELHGGTLNALEKKGFVNIYTDAVLKFPMVEISIFKITEIFIKFYNKSIIW